MEATAAAAAVVVRELPKLPRALSYRKAVKSLFEHNFEMGKKGTQKKESNSTCKTQAIRNERVSSLKAGILPPSLNETKCGQYT